MAAQELQVVDVHDALHVLEGQILHFEADPVEANFVELLNVRLNPDNETVVLWEATDPTFLSLLMWSMESSPAGGMMFISRVAWMS